MSKPDWNIAVINGQPEAVVNMAAIGMLIHLSPLGVDEATRRLKLRMPAEYHSQIDAAVEAAA